MVNGLHSPLLVSHFLSVLNTSQHMISYLRGKLARLSRHLLCGLLKDLNTDLFNGLNNHQMSSVNPINSSLSLVLCI